MRALPIALTGFVTCMFLVACGGNSTRPDTSSTPTDTQKSAAATPAASSGVSGTVRVQQVTPYAENGQIDPAVKSECRINTQLPQFIAEFGQKHGTNVAITPKVNASDKGTNLVVEIVQAYSAGNAFTGHRKYTKIEAKLYQDGKEIADLTAARASGGGFFAGYKGSCSVMGRTVKTLGEDVALWLKTPGPGMRKGNL